MSDLFEGLWKILPILKQNSFVGGEQAWTPIFYPKSFDMDSVQGGKAVFGKEIYTTLGIEPRTYSNPKLFIIVAKDSILPCQAMQSCSFPIPTTCRRKQESQ